MVTHFEGKPPVKSIYTMIRPSYSSRSYEMPTGLKRTFALLLMVALMGGATPASGYADKPEDVYLEGYLAFQKGDELFNAANYYDALPKLREAKDRFDYVWRTWPTWQPQMVEYRRKAVHELVAKCEVEVNRMVAEVEPGGKSLPPPEPRPPGNYSSNPMEDAAERYRALEEENRRQKQYLAEKERQIEQARRDRESADRERQRLQVQVTELEGRARMSVEASEKLAEAQRSVESANANERLAKQKVADLESRLENVVAAEREKLQAEISAARKAAADAEVGRANLEQKVAALGEELKIARAAAEQAQGMLEEAQSAAQAMQSAVGEANARADSFLREKEELTPPDCRDGERSGANHPDRG